MQQAGRDVPKRTGGCEGRSAGSEAEPDGVRWGGKRGAAEIWGTSTSLATECRRTSPVPRSISANPATAAGECTAATTWERCTSGVGREPGLAGGGAPLQQGMRGGADDRVPQRRVSVCAGERGWKDEGEAARMFHKACDGGDLVGCTKHGFDAGPWRRRSTKRNPGGGIVSKERATGKRWRAA